MPRLLNVNDMKVTASLIVNENGSAFDDDKVLAIVGSEAFKPISLRIRLLDQIFSAMANAIKCWIFHGLNVRPRMSVHGHVECLSREAQEKSRLGQTTTSCRVGLMNAQATLVDASTHYRAFRRSYVLEQQTWEGKQHAIIQL